MAQYSVQLRDRTFGKGYGFLSFAKNTGKNIDKNTMKNVSSKYSQKFLYHTEQSATVALKIDSIRTVHKTAEATGDLIGNKIAKKNYKKITTKFFRDS